MMALKLGSLAQGASGVQPRDARPHRGDAGARRHSGRARRKARSARRAISRRSRHMAAAMIGVGEARLGGRSRPAAAALAEAGLAPIALRPKEGLALLNGTQFSTANALIGLFEAETLFRSALATGALSTDGGARIGYAVRRAHPCAAAPSRPDRGRRVSARAARGQRHSRFASHRRRTGPGPLLPALPAAGDGRLSRSPAPGRGDAGRRKPTRSPTIR